MAKIFTSKLYTVLYYPKVEMKFLMDPLNMKNEGLCLTRILISYTIHC
jgi:hypothetical protein